MDELIVPVFVVVCLVVDAIGVADAFVVDDDAAAAADDDDGGGGGGGGDDAADDITFDSVV